MSLPNFTAIHLIVAEIFKSKPQINLIVALKKRVEDHLSQIMYVLNFVAIHSENVEIFQSGIK